MGIISGTFRFIFRFSPLRRAAYTFFARHVVPAMAPLKGTGAVVDQSMSSGMISHYRDRRSPIDGVLRPVIETFYRHEEGHVVARLSLEVSPNPCEWMGLSFGDPKPEHPISCPRCLADAAGVEDDDEEDEEEDEEDDRV